MIGLCERELNRASDLPVRRSFHDLVSSGENTAKRAHIVELLTEPFLGGLGLLVIGSFVGTVFAAAMPFAISSFRTAPCRTRMLKPFPDSNVSSGVHISTKFRIFLLRHTSLIMPLLVLGSM